MFLLGSLSDIITNNIFIVIHARSKLLLSTVVGPKCLLLYPTIGIILSLYYVIIVNETFG